MFTTYYERNQMSSSRKLLKGLEEESKKGACPLFLDNPEMTVFCIPLEV
jgi:hypothetical protein